MTEKEEKRLKELEKILHKLPEEQQMNLLFYGQGLSARPEEMRQKSETLAYGA